MKNIAYKIFLVLVGVFFSALVSATCLPIQGTLQTQSIDGTDQVGTITMTSSNLLAFRKAFGQIFIIGGIKGTITNQTVATIYLDHEIGFPGIGSLISVNDAATFTGNPDKEGNYPTTETGAIEAAPNPYGGAFNGWTFPDGWIATGTVGTKTGTNAFTYTGKICK